jgi:hypothetical protein
VASAELSRRVGRVVAYPRLVQMDDQQRCELQEALLEPTLGSRGAPGSMPTSAGK